MGSNTECLERANYLITACKLPFPTVNSISDLNSQFFISLFNVLCSVPLLDLKESKTERDEIHNIQVVIDTLSLDVLNIALSHITGEDIVAKNVTSIGNLLEIFEAYLRHSSKVFKVNQTDKRLIESEAHVTDSDVNLSCTCSSGKKPCPICKSDSTGIHKAQVSEASKDASRDQFLRVSTSTSFRSFEKISETSSEFIESPRTKSEDCRRINISEKSYVNVNKSFPSEQDLHRVREKPTTQVSYDQVIERSVHQIETSSCSSAESSYKEIAKFSISEPDLRHINQNLPPRTSYESFINRTLQRMPTSSSSLEDSYKDMPKLSSSSQKPSTSQVKHLPDYVQPTTSKMHMRFRRINDLDEQAIPKRKFSSSSSSEESIKDPIIQTTDSLLLKKPRTEEDTIRTHERAYKEALSPKYLRRKSLRSCKKSFLLPTDLRRSRRTPHRKSSTRNKSSEPITNISLNQRSSNSSHVTNEENGKNRVFVNRGEKSDYDELDFFRNIREAFPGIHISENTMKNMKDKYFKHLAVLHKSIQDELLKKTPLQVQVEEALRKQKAIADLMQKDLEHACRLNDIKEYQDLAQKYKSKIRDDKLESAKIHQYYEKYYKDFQKKMRNARDNGEMMLGGLLSDKLNREKNDVRHLLKEFKERQEKEASCNKVYLEALENLYQTEFNLLADTLVDENRNAVLRAKAQEKFLRDKKRALKQKMKDEIEDMQENMIRNQRDTHFLEMDIQRYREDSVKRRH